MSISVYHLIWIVPLSMVAGVGAFLWAAAWAIGQAEREQQEMEDEYFMTHSIENENS